MPPPPRVLEPLVSLPAALRTGTVPGGQKRSLVQGEKFTIAIWTEDNTMAAPELQLTDDPVGVPPTNPPELTVLVV